MANTVPDMSFLQTCVLHTHLSQQLLDSLCLLHRHGVAPLDQGCPLQHALPKQQVIASIAFTGRADGHCSTSSTHNLMFYTCAAVAVSMSDVVSGSVCCTGQLEHDMPGHTVVM
jgi:hypothetical protein